jgi:hypothetical protein
VKQSRIHLDIARSIVDTLADGESFISLNAAVQVLKPLLKDHITRATLKVYKLPQDWFTDEVTAKDKLLNELSSYLQSIGFIEP